MPDIRPAFGCPTITVVLLLLAAGGLAFLFYRFTIPPVNRPRRILLTTLRAATLATLVLLLCQPVLHLTSRETVRPALALLIDNSRSLRLTDSQGDRTASIASALTSPALRDVEEHGTLLRYRFGTGLHLLAPEDTLSFDEPATDIAGALRDIFERKDRDNIRAVALITDGVYTLGRNPLHDADGAPVPLFTVGIGDSSLQRDVLVARIAANAVVYSGTPTPVDVTIRSSGMQDERAEVLLSEGTTVLGRQTLRLGPGARDFALRFTYTPQGQGVRNYTIRVSTFPGELTERNNRRMFSVRIRKSRLLVVHIAGAPAPDVAILRHTLNQDPAIHVRPFTQKRTGGCYEGELTGATLDSADCLLLTNMPTSSTPPSVRSLIAGTVTRRRTPVLYITGRSTGQPGLAEWQNFLPFVPGAESRGEQEVQVEPAPAERFHPLIMLGRSEAVEIWRRLPPLYRTQTAIRAKPDAHILGFTRLGGTTLPDPLLIIRTSQQQKTLAITAYGVWRWQLQAQGSPETGDFLSTFLSAAVQWLTTEEDARPVIVRPVSESLTQGEPAAFLGQVYDQAMRPVDDAQILLEIDREGIRTEGSLTPIGNGRYEGTVDGLVEGPYRYRAIAAVHGAPLGADSGRFVVGALDVEFLETRMNASLLRAMAQRSGGRFLTLSTLDELPLALAGDPQFIARENTSTTTLDLRSLYLVAALIVLALAAEWLIRRGSGML